MCIIAFRVESAALEAELWKCAPERQLLQRSDLELEVLATQPQRKTAILYEHAEIAILLSTKRQ